MESSPLPAPAAEPTLIHVNTFPNARALPFYVGGRARLFRQAWAERRACNSPRARQASAPRSRAARPISCIRRSTTRVAMIDVAKDDIVIVGGGDSGTNEFYVQDDIKRFSDIRGHAIVVDATNTAYALAGEEDPAAARPRSRQGLHPQSGRQRFVPAARALQRQEQCRRHPQSAVLASSRGAKACTASAAPPICSAPIRPAATSCAAPGRATTPQTLVNYLAAYIEALRWSLDPNNRAAAVDILSTS